MAASNVALIVGVTGIVGNGLLEAMQKPGAAGGPWKIYGTARRPKPEWFDAEEGNVEYIQCDLLDRQDMLHKLSPLRSTVTHLFWATWTTYSKHRAEYLGGAAEEEHTANVEMLRNLLDAVLAPGSSSRLKHICLTIGARYYLLSSGPVHPLPFREDRPRGVEPGKQHQNWYFDQEDLVFEACSRRPELTWSVHRANVVFGFAPRNIANLLAGLTTYATLCKYLDLKFTFPGQASSWKMVNNFSDSRVVAEQELWAATTEAAKNQAFNVINGDFLTWEQLWTVLAKALNLETENYLMEGFSIVKFMEDKQEVWNKIVSENKLVETKLAVSWWMLDMCFGVQLNASRDKCKQFGFTCTIDSNAAIRYWVQKLMQKKIIPGERFWKV